MKREISQLPAVISKIQLWLITLCLLGAVSSTSAQLTLVEELADDSTDQAGNPLAFLDNHEALVISPDGRHLYVAGGELSIVVFSRDMNTGILTWVEDLVDMGMDAQGNMLNHLGTLESIDISPDGRHIYAGGNNDAVVVFSRNATTGVLTHVEDILEDMMDQMGNVVSRLNKIAEIRVSPDGKHVYVVGDDAGMTVFSRDATTGVLTLVEEILDNGMDQSGNSVTVLNEAEGMTLSPDGRHVYVVAKDDELGDTSGILVFARNMGNGVLTLVEEIFDDSLDQAGNPITELREGENIAVSPDGRHVYVVGEDDAVLVMSRNASTGVLTFIEELVDGGFDRFGTPITGLFDAEAVRLTADGRFLVAFGNSNAVVLFMRDQTNGQLAFIEAIFNDQTDNEGNNLSFLEEGESIAISPDGKFIYLVNEGDRGAITVLYNNAGGVVPSLTEWGVIILGLSLIVVGIVAFKQELWENQSPIESIRR